MARYWDAPTSERPAAEGDPRLEPLFPIGPLVPDSACPHYQVFRDVNGNLVRDANGAVVRGPGPLPDGTRFVCMICHKAAAWAERRARESRGRGWID